MRTLTRSLGLIGLLGLFSAAVEAAVPSVVRVHTPLFTISGKGKAKPFKTGADSQFRTRIRLYLDADKTQPIYDTNGQVWFEDLFIVTTSDPSQAGCQPEVGLYVEPYKIKGEYDLIIGATKPMPEAATTSLAYFSTQLTPFAKNGLEGKSFPESGAMVLGVGSKGPKGDKGATGTQGPKGDKGNAGSSGPKGDKGATGSQGPKGDKGTTGSQGPKGDKGTTGSQGPKGSKGDKGDKGSKGDKGDKGDSGPSQTGALEMRWAAGTPHIDFTNDNENDFDVRLFHAQSNKLVLVPGSHLTKKAKLGLNMGQASEVDTVLHVNGNAKAVEFVATSDRRLKKNLKVVESALEKVLSLSGYSYEFDRSFDPRLALPEGRRVGFLAQELAEVIPEAVTYFEGEGTYGVCYDAVVPVLVEAIKEQAAQEQLMMAAFGEQFAKQQRELDAMRAELRALSGALDG